jgi:hypothetical protein
MLRELTSDTHPDKDVRRWFSDGAMDLIVWTETGKIKYFQLCYDKRGTERAVTWFRGRGFIHERIDDGEKDPEKNQTPILVPDVICPVANVTDSFLKRSAGIDEAVRSFVLKNLMTLPIS